MEDSDRHLLQMAVVDGQLNSDYLNDEDLLELELKLMEAILLRKISEGLIVVEPTSRLQ
jgi:hypothetical protein